MKKVVLLSGISMLMLFTSAMPVPIDRVESAQTVLPTQAAVSTPVTIRARYYLLGIPLAALLATVENETTGLKTTANLNGEAHLNVSAGDIISGTLNVAGIGLLNGYTIVTSTDITNGEVDLILQLPI
jgi:hypothetical protein